MHRCTVSVFHPLTSEAIYVYISFVVPVSSHSIISDQCSSQNVWQQNAICFSVAVYVSQGSFCIEFSCIGFQWLFLSLLFESSSHYFLSCPQHFSVLDSVLIVMIDLKLSVLDNWHSRLKGLSRSLLHVRESLSLKLCHFQFLFLEINKNLMT